MLQQDYVVFHRSWVNHELAYWIAQNKEIEKASLHISLCLPNFIISWKYQLS